MADSGNQLLLLLGGRASRRLTFGYGRRYILRCVSVYLCLGSLFALYEGYEAAMTRTVLRVAVGSSGGFDPALE